MKLNEAFLQLFIKLWFPSIVADNRQFDWASRSTKLTINKSFHSAVGFL